MKIFLNLIFFVFLHFTSQSQNLYLTASSGYNLGVSRSNFENYIYNKLVAVVYPYDIDRTVYSLGKAVDFNLGIGYSTRHNIGFEITGSYMHGLKTIGKSQYIQDDVFKKEIYGRFYRISPSIHFISDFRKISLRMYLGGIVGFGKMYLNQEGVYQGTPWMRYENEFSGGIYFGLKAGAGVIYPIGDRLSLFADVNWINAYYSPAKARVTKFISGDHDYTDILQPSEREIHYSDQVGAPPYDPNQPLKKLKERFAASSIGLQVGVQWSLWKRTAEVPE